VVPPLLETPPSPAGIPPPSSAPAPLATAPEPELAAPDAPVDPVSPLAELPPPDETVPDPTDEPLAGPDGLPVEATPLPTPLPGLGAMDPDSAVDFPELLALGPALEQAPTKASPQAAPRARKGHRPVRICIDSSPQVECGAQSLCAICDLRTRVDCAFASRASSGKYSLVAGDILLCRRALFTWIALLPCGCALPLDRLGEAACSLALAARTGRHYKSWSMSFFATCSNAPSIMPS
jgi:hypothetical protein